MGTEGYGDSFGTLTLGLSGAKTNQLGIGGAVGLCIDEQGNIGMVFSGTGAIGTPASGLIPFLTFTDAESIRDLNGPSVQVGGSALYIGAEAVNFMGAESQEDHYGTTVYFDLLSILARKAPAIPEGHVSGSVSYVWRWANVRE